MRSVSVVIMTANRRALLAQALGALGSGTALPAEVVIVNNQSTDDTEQYLASARFAFPHRVIPGPEGTFTECRNAGVAAATSELVAFIDDDCEVDRFWLERLLAALDRNQWVAAGGAVLPAAEMLSPNWYSPELAWTIGCSTPTFFGKLGGRLDIPTTSNLIFERRLAADFPFREITSDKSSLTWNYEYSREDSQFWRELRRAGLPVGVEPTALVWHHLPLNRINRDRARERARQDGRGFWNRERLVEEIRPAARDIAFAPFGALEDTYRRGIPLSQSWESRTVWARRQWAFLEYALDDPDTRISPMDRVGMLLGEGARALASAAKQAIRPGIAAAHHASRGDRAIPQAGESPARIQVVLHDMLGDAVLALPMVGQLALAFPGTRIDLLAGPVSAPVLRANVPENVRVREVPDAARGRSPRAAWQFARFLDCIVPDVVLLAYCHGISPAPLFLQAGAPVVGWRGDNGLKEQVWGDLLAAPVAKSMEKPEVAAILDLLAPFGIAARLERPRVLPSAPALERRTRLLERAGADPGTYAVLHVEADSRDKFWPLASFLGLADELHARGFPVLLVGSREGRMALAGPLRKRPWCHSLHGALDSDELAALLAGALFFVGCDSGPAHLAQAVGAPAMVLFGMTGQHRWGPLPRLEGEEPPPIRTLSAGPGDLLPEECRGLPVNHAMRLLAVERVVAALELPTSMAEFVAGSEESR